MAGIGAAIAEGIAAGAAATITEHILNHGHDSSSNNHTTPDFHPGPSYIPPIPDFGNHQPNYCPIPNGGIGSIGGW